MNNTSTCVVVAAFYRFAKFPDFESFREPLQELMLKKQVRGTLLLAAEGINGSIAGSRDAIDSILAWLHEDERFRGLEAKESYVNQFLDPIVDLRFTDHIYPLTTLAFFILTYNLIFKEGYRFFINI